MTGSSLFKQQRKHTSSTPVVTVRSMEAFTWARWAGTSCRWAQKIALSHQVSLLPATKPDEWLPALWYNNLLSSRCLINTPTGLPSCKFPLSWLQDYSKESLICKRLPTFWAASAQHEHTKQNLKWNCNDSFLAWPGLVYWSHVHSKSSQKSSG